MVASLISDKLGNYGVLTSGYEREAPERAVTASNLSSVGLMLLLGFLFVSGISLYVKRGYRIKNGCAYSNRGVVADGR
jgi:hypothetical protein